MENFTGSTDCPACHGYSGEVDVINQAASPSPVWETFRDAVLAQFPNLTVIQDYNGVSQEGIFRQYVHSPSRPSFASPMSTSSLALEEEKKNHSLSSLPSRLIFSNFRF